MLAGRTVLWRGLPHTVRDCAYRQPPGAGYVLLCETAEGRLVEVLADGVTLDKEKQSSQIEDYDESKHGHLKPKDLIDAKAKGK